MKAMWTMPLRGQRGQAYGRLTTLPPSLGKRASRIYHIDHKAEGDLLGMKKDETAGGLRGHCAPC